MFCAQCARDDARVGCLSRGLCAACAHNNFWQAARANPQYSRAISAVMSVGSQRQQLSNFCDILASCATKIIADNILTWSAHVSGIKFVPDFQSDCIACAMTTRDKRHWVHPNIVSRQEMENGSWAEDFSDRMRSALEGNPSRHFTSIKPAIDFTMAELDEARKVIDECNQS